MEQARRLKVQVQDVHEEKMVILSLVSATLLESNVDMVLVRVDGLSYTVFVSASGQKKLDGFVVMHLQQSIAQRQPGQD